MRTIKLGIIISLIIITLASSYTRSTVTSDESFGSSLKGYFVYPNARCIDDPIQVIESEISMSQCAEICSNRADCRAFTQHETGQQLKGGCFLHVDTDRCRGGAEGWITALKGGHYSYVTIIVINFQSPIHSMLIVCFDHIICNCYSIME
jgi:hypothetical protein